MMPRIPTRSEAGVSLIVTLVIAAGISVLVGGVLYFTSTKTTLTRRVSQYDCSVAAGVAATEKVVTRITKDFQGSGESLVLNNLSTYQGLVPTADELFIALKNVTGLTPSQPSDVVWAKYRFADPGDQVNRTYVERTSPWSFRVLDTKFSGLRGYGATYRIVSNLRHVTSPYNIVSAVKQEIQVASIPLCEYQVFYVPDLEISPSSGLSLNGRVHGNANMYFQPAGNVTFGNYVTAGRRIFHSKHPSDPTARGAPSITYQGERESGVNTLTIPVGTNNTPAVLRALVEMPSVGELPGSPMGQQRLYNKADLIVTVSDTGIIARSGIYNGSSVIVPWMESRGIVKSSQSQSALDAKNAIKNLIKDLGLKGRDKKTAVDLLNYYLSLQNLALGFRDAREWNEVNTTELDVAKLIANYTDLTTLLGRPAKVIWIADLRVQPVDTIPGIRIVNASALPSAGLTIATPQPLYVLGNFNASSVTLGTTNTTTAVPACLIADAVTVLSGAWTDANSYNSLSSRIGTSTTINAAVITGIVPTSSAGYSGGVENSLRLLEDWTGKTLTFNGSVSVLFYGQVATAPWGGTDVYAPPTRNWSYDWNFTDSAKLPPAMPEARTVLRSDWTTIKPYSKL